MSVRVIAVDWSGALSGERRKIWLAEARDGRLVRLECGRSRDEVAGHLIDEAERDPQMAVGLDFAFSMPEWYLRERGYNTAHDLWAAMDGGGAERILAECPSPFFGRKGTRRPDTHALFRQCEQRIESVRGIRPKSVFQIAGAGAVGTGSLRGMPVLHRLHAAGFSIWPFDVPAPPVVVEIYPRLLTGPVTKSDRNAREQYLVGERFASLDAPLRETAAECEDSFDAAISAIVMAEHAHALTSLPAADDPVTAIEGAIWAPRGDAG